MGKVTVVVTGGCLIATSVVMLLFYVKNYIDTHGKELGILKALGYSNMRIAKHFWIFGISVFAGCLIGYTIAFLYLPTFYEVQNAEGLFPKLDPQFHPLLTFALIFAPTVAFTVISVVFAYAKLKNPVLELLREKREYRTLIGRESRKDYPFLKGLSNATLTSRKALVFFVAFSAFCFSAMVQMSLSMNELASDTLSLVITTS